MPFTTEELVYMEPIFADTGGFPPADEEILNSIHAKIVALIGE